MKKTIFFIFFLMLTVALFAQSKKQVKEFKIKSTTIWKADNTNTSPIKKEYEEFDKSGRTTTLIDYKSDGTTIKLKKTTKYNADGDEIEECEYDANGLIKKTITAYKANGDKSSETEYDGKGNIVKKSIYTYDTKGLRLTKQTYNAENVLVSGEKYVYEYE